MPLIDCEQAAALLGGIPVKTVRQLAREHRIPSIKIGRRVMFSEARLAAAVGTAFDEGERL
ncbi:MAG: helix-turn-helix domain-containing protein [Patulibacter sp.]|nr:helix-turn-helix domain-containing protein [Patulibacter sp.]